MSFRLVPKSVTLNDLEQRNGLYFALSYRIWQPCQALSWSWRFLVCLANLNSRSSSSLYAIARLSIICLSLSFVCPILSRLKFSAMFLRHLVPWPSIDIQLKFFRRSSQGNPSVRGFNARGAAKYSDF